MESNSTRKGHTTYPLTHRLFRLAWSLTWALLASWTPTPLHRWRVFLLNIAGARVHQSAHVYPTARIWYPPNLIMEEHTCLGPKVNCYNMATVLIEKRATVSQGAHLCAGTHDINDPTHPLVTRPISIGQSAWIAAEAFVGPGVTIARSTVVGARAVVFRDTEEFGVYTGNPAKLVKHRDRASAESTDG
ncbi:putative colanic acid biosynthesis acetyltransferase [Stenotrophomonas maltophilia]|nr:putative colanic acid biosynthesis acetyltransferase [Stenotrophomonas maltophilia]